ncbi:efflux RND transporter periplasmic adaptor subunit [Solirubrobacter soli]|uniref:efflux RND transporter periplasmic adaptor subunit n=1 Tax=Solirubrobacter soli TaxID=363832 RepID=UPI000A019935|nr:HlyD family efflux transporter periplasmic adaptor subunit [Solirubrobacter soli]
MNVAMAAVAAVAVGGAATVVGGGSSSAATTTSRTVTVKRGVVQETVSGSGNLEAVKQSDLSFDQAGEITRVYVSEGEHVDAGEALLRLQPTDETQGVTWIRAPFSGTVASLGVAKGDIVSGSGSTDSTAQVTLAKLSKYDLQVSLSESDIGKVKTGQLATVTVSATGEELAAKVIDVGVLSSSSSSDSGATSSSSSSAVAYPVTLRLTQTGKDLKLGMTASADIVTSQATGLTVPTQALRGNTLTLSTGATARVQTGVKGDSTTEIVSGVKAGDKVVVTSTSAAAGAGATGSDSATQQPSQVQNGGFGAGGFGGGTGGPPAGGAPPAGIGR